MWKITYRMRPIGNWYSNRLSSRQEAESFCDWLENVGCEVRVQLEDVSERPLEREQRHLAHCAQCR